MGLLICKKHGDQGFYHLCEHTFLNFKKDDYAKTHTLHFRGALVCDDCWKTFEIEKLENHPDIKGKRYFAIRPEKMVDEKSLIYQEYKKVLEKLNFESNIWCWQCAKE